MKDVAVIGGGVIGLSSAYYLRKAGYSVTVFDKGDMQSGCSYGNAGMIVPSHLVPLAAPGMISKGLRWMFNSSSPFYIRPRLDRDLFRWGYHFYRSATDENVERGASALKALSLFSQTLYETLERELPDFGYERRGLLMLYQTAEAEKEEEETAALANRQGVEARILSAAAVQVLEPDVQVTVRGGVYFPGDAHLVPQSLMASLKISLEGLGIEFKSGAEVCGFDREKNTVKLLRTSQGDFSFEQYVIAAGAWSGPLARLIGLSLPMQAGKGYSLTREMQRPLRIPSILLEARVAVTPMGHNIRFGGTMEVAGISHTISMDRVAGIVRSISRYYPEMKVDMPEPREVWHGLRPCSPDGLPYIGRLRNNKNVIVATGHAMMGVSLGPGTGKLVAEIADEKTPALSLAAFDPARFS